MAMEVQNVVGSKVNLNSLYWSGPHVHLYHWCMVQLNVTSLLTLYIEVDLTFTLENQLTSSSSLVHGATHITFLLTLYIEVDPIFILKSQMFSISFE